MEITVILDNPKIKEAFFRFLDTLLHDESTAVECDTEESGTHSKD
jgi:hypothetical protein